MKNIDNSPKPLYNVKDIPRYLKFFHCSLCNSPRPKKIISIGSNIKIPFCGKEKCKKHAIKQGMDIYYALKAEEKKQQKKKEKGPILKFVFQNIF